MSIKVLLTAAFSIGIQLIAPSVVLADGAEDNVGSREENPQHLHYLSKRDDYRTAEALETAKQFAKAEKYDKADKAFKQAEELMLGYKGDQFFLKIIYRAQMCYLSQHNRKAECETVDVKLKAAVLRIPYSPSYQGYVYGRDVNPHQTMKTLPTIPDGPPIPDDQ